MNYIEKARKNTAIAKIIGEAIVDYAGVTATEIYERILTPKEKEAIAILQYNRRDYSDTEIIGTITAMLNGSTGYLKEYCDYEFSVAEPALIKQVDCRITDAFTGEFYKTVRRSLKMPARYKATYKPTNH